MKKLLNIISIVVILLTISYWFWITNYVEIELKNYFIKYSTYIVIFICLIIWTKNIINWDISFSRNIKILALLKLGISAFLLLIFIATFIRLIIPEGETTEKLLYTNPEKKNHKAILFYNDHGAFGGVQGIMEVYEILNGGIWIVLQKKEADGQNDFIINGKTYKELIKTKHNKKYNSSRS